MMMNVVGTELDIIEGSHMYFKHGKAERFTEWDDLSETQREQLVQLRAELQQVSQKVSVEVADVFRGDDQF